MLSRRRSRCLMLVTALFLAGICSTGAFAALQDTQQSQPAQSPNPDKATLPSNPFDNAPPPPSAPETTPDKPSAADQAGSPSEGKGKPSAAIGATPDAASPGTTKSDTGKTEGAKAGSPAAEITAPTAAQTVPNSLLDKPAQPAKVTMASGRLTVEADNSSLSQILHHLATDSGMKIDGLSHDQRVFGQYGPGDPRDILTSLLEDAGYNVLMVGENANGTPQQLILTARSNSPVANQPATPSGQQDEDDDDSANTQPPEMNPPPRMPMPVQQQEPPPNPNGTPRTAQQILQELEQMRQKQQQAQPQ